MKDEQIKKKRTDKQQTFSDVFDLHINDVVDIDTRFSSLSDDDLHGCPFLFFGFLFSSVARREGNPCA